MCRRKPLITTAVPLAVTVSVVVVPVACAPMPAIPLAVVSEAIAEPDALTGFFAEPVAVTMAVDGVPDALRRRINAVPDA